MFSKFSRQYFAQLQQQTVSPPPPVIEIEFAHNFGSVTFFRFYAHYDAGHACIIVNVFEVSHVTLIVILRKFCIVVTQSQKKCKEKN